jgi:hypothetical protein
VIIATRATGLVFFLYRVICATDGCPFRLEIEKSLPEPVMPFVAYFILWYGISGSLSA